MEAEILIAKMESLSRCILRIESKCPDQKHILKENLDLQDIIVINLERAVQQCVDTGLHILSDYAGSPVNSMADVFQSLAKNSIISEKLALNLIAAVGFRNIAVHEYRSIDWNIVWSIINANLNDFRDFQKAVLHLLS
ncbi:MAG: hypothetical protein B6241_01185 [Spirochaetaceae bacterium 4572_59]|nr:MAG: hypothetical protein B6241_01185 [Spirochaetaceae bacterium 4572_59]